MHITKSLKNQNLKKNLAQCCFGSPLDTSESLNSWTTKSGSIFRRSSISQISNLSQKSFSLNHFGQMNRHRKNGFLFLGLPISHEEPAAPPLPNDDQENSRTKSHRATKKLINMKLDIHDMIYWRRNLEKEKLKRFDWRAIETHHPTD